MRYAAPWDRTLRLATIGVVAILATVAGIVSFVGWMAAGEEFLPFAAALVALFAAVVLLARAFAPTGFSISGHTVRIERRLRPLAFPLSRVRAAGPLPDGAARGSLRLGGGGGLFGWYGRHWNRTLGEFRLYATRTGGLVQLDTPEGRWVLSPEPPDRFLDEVLALAPGAVRVAPDGPHARHAVARGTWVRLAAFIALVPAVAAAIALGSAAWSPVAARIEDGAIRIERRWVAPVEIPLSAVRAAEILRRDGVGRVWKVAGTAVGGTAYGRFRSSGLGDFRLYAWRRGPWVLLETDGGRIVLTPEEPERFVADVRAAIPRGRPRRRRRARGAPPCPAGRGAARPSRPAHARPSAARRSTGSRTAG
jgi:hypothetical protein